MSNNFKLFLELYFYRKEEMHTAFPPKTFIYN